MPNEPAPQIRIDVTVTDLSDEQKAHFGDVIEFWDNAQSALYDQPDAASVDPESIAEAIRVTFIGAYEPEDDDFTGSTYFTRSLTESDTPEYFRKTDKQRCATVNKQTGNRLMRSHQVATKYLLDILSAYSLVDNPGHSSHYRNVV